MVLEHSKRVFFKGFLFLFWITISHGQTQDNSVVASTSPQNNGKFTIQLGGLFTIYNRGTDENCDQNSPVPYSIETSEMALYAIDMVNQDETILPGVELVLTLSADCLIDTVALQKVLASFTDQCGHNDTEAHSNRFWGIIGPSSSGVAVPVAKLLGLFNFPQISYSATSTGLSDKQRFPSFFRTVSSDFHQVKAIIDLLIYNEWDFVSFLHEDDDYGNAAFDAFTQQIRNSSICIAQGHKLRRGFNDTDAKELVRKLTEETRSRVVITFVFESQLRMLFDQVHRQNQSQSFQWIGSDGWSGLIPRNCSFDFKDEDESRIIPPVIDGSIYFQLHSFYQSDIEEYLHSRTIEQAKKNNPYFASYLAYLHNCSVEENLSNSCSPNLTLPASTAESTMRSSTSLNAVYAYAHALDQALKDICEEGEICPKFKTMNGSLLVDYLRNVSFTDEHNSTFQFDSNHDGPVWYDILRYNATTGCLTLIGEYTDEIHFIEEAAAGGRGNVRSTCSDPCSSNQFQVLHEEKSCCWHCTECPPNAGLNYSYEAEATGNARKACFFCNEFSFPVEELQECEVLPAKFLSFEDSLAWAVAVASIIGCFLTIFAGVVYVCFWDTPLIRASGRELSSLILVGIFLTFAVSFLFCVKPTDFICGARRFGIGFCFTLVFAGLLVKTIRISIVFNHLGKRLVRDYKLILRPTPQIAFALLLTCVEVFVLIIWFLNVPPQMVVNSSPFDAEVRYRIIDCEGLDSHGIFIGLGYPIILILVCAFYAIKIRKVPAGFNEAKYIGFAVYTTLVIWLAQLSTYFVQITSEIELRDAIYCLCLSLNALIILLAIFGPKVYIALLRPEKNHQRTVMASNNRTSVSHEGTQGGTNSFHKVDDENGIDRKPVSSVQHFHANHCACCPLGRNPVDGVAKGKALPEAKPKNETSIGQKLSSTENSEKISNKCKESTLKTICNGSTCNFDSKSESLNSACRRSSSNLSNASSLRSRSTVRASSDGQQNLAFENESSVDKTVANPF